MRRPRPELSFSAIEREKCSTYIHFYCYLHRLEYLYRMVLNFGVGPLSIFRSYPEATNSANRNSEKNLKACFPFEYICSSESLVIALF